MLAKFMRKRLQGLNKVEKEDFARKWKTRLSIAYMLIGWNLLTLTIYHIFSTRYPSVNKDYENSERYQSLLEFENIKQAKVIRFQGLSKIAEYDVINKNATEE